MKKIIAQNTEMCLNSLINFLETPEYFDLELDIIHSMKPQVPFSWDTYDYDINRIARENKGLYTPSFSVFRITRPSFNEPVPPFTNRGGMIQLSDNKQLKSHPPLSSFFTESLAPRFDSTVKTSVDYLSMTFKYDVVLDYYVNKYPVHYGSIHPLSHDLDGSVLVRFLLDDFVQIVPDMWYSESVGGLFGYKKSGTIARGLTTAGKYAYCGNDSLMVSFSGQGTSLVNMVKIYDFISKLNAKITRIDVAYDDLEGAISFKDWCNHADSGAFDPSKGGSSPSLRKITCSDNKGDTLYIGNLKNGKEICIYEKGKQQGSKNSPWVRVEGRLRNIDRVIPLSILLAPAAYFMGLSAAFSIIADNPGAPRIDIVKKTLEVSLEHLVKYCSIAYGKLVNVLVEMGKSNDEIIEMLLKDGIPRRLVKVSY